MERSSSHSVTHIGDPPGGMPSPLGAELRWAGTVSGHPAFVQLSITAQLKQPIRREIPERRTNRMCVDPF